MAEAVLDASALVAFLRDEPGADKVAAVLAQSCMSAVNLAETISKMVEYGKPLDEVSYQIKRPCGSMSYPLMPAWLRSLLPSGKQHAPRVFRLATAQGVWPWPCNHPSQP